MNQTQHSEKINSIIFLSTLIISLSFIHITHAASFSSFKPSFSSPSISSPKMSSPSMSSFKPSMSMPKITSPSIRIPIMPSIKIPVTPKVPTTSMPKITNPNSKIPITSPKIGTGSLGSGIKNRNLGNSFGYNTMYGSGFYNYYHPYYPLPFPFWLYATMMMSDSSRLPLYYNNFHVVYHGGNTSSVIYNSSNTAQ